MLQEGLVAGEHVAELVEVKQCTQTSLSWEGISWNWQQIPPSAPCEDETYTKKYVNGKCNGKH